MLGCMSDEGPNAERLAVAGQAVVRLRGAPRPEGASRPSTRPSDKA